MKIKKIAKTGGQIANNTRIDIEEKLGRSIINNENSLNYQYKDNDNLLEKK